MKPNPAWQSLVALALAAVLLFGSAPPAWCGDGEIREDELDLSVMFTYRESDLDAWRPLFDEASRLLYNATNGQLQLGTIRVLACSYRKHAADVWILDDYSGAFANLLGLGGIGHVYLSQTHRSVETPAIGQFGFVHELGHYVFGVYDEYKGFVQQNGALLTEQGCVDMPYQFCVADDDSVGCIMDGGSLISPNHLRTEFCSRAHGGLGTDHNPGIEVDGVLYVNAQQALNGESCWETIARVVGLESPDSVTTADPAGLEPIEWIVVPPYDRAAIAFDRSSSMNARPERLALAREAAALLTTLLPARKTVTIGGAPVTLPGSHLAVVSFGHDPTVEIPIDEIASETARDSLRTVFEEIHSTDPAVFSTDIGAGVGSSLDQIASEGEIPSCTEAVVLFSDGGHNLGPDPLTLLPELRERGVKVYPVGVGAGIETAILEALADSTGGRFFPVATSEEVPIRMAALAAELLGGGHLATIDGSISGPDEYLPIFVDSFLEELIVICSWEEEGVLDMSLISPTGEEISVETAGLREDIEGSRLPGVVFLRVVRPEAGEWLARIQAIEVPGTAAFTLTVLGQTRSVVLDVTTDQDRYAYPEPIRIRADLIADVPVAGATVTAIVHRPAGAPVEIQLRDGGAAQDGDLWAHDGVYNAVFREFAGDGVYTIAVTATNVDGSGPDPSLPFMEDGPGPPQIVPPFRREAEVSVEVSGVAPLVVGDLDFDPQVLSTQGNSGQARAFVELPAPHEPAEIDAASVVLNGVLHPLPLPPVFGDHDGDGVPDVRWKFLRDDLFDVLPVGPAIEVRLSGVLAGGERFEAADTITVLAPGPEPLRVSPDTLRAGGTARLEWPAVSGSPLVWRGFASEDGGSRWLEIFGGLSDRTGIDWRVRPGLGPELVFLVQAETPEGIVAQALSAPVLVQGGAPTAVEDPSRRTAILGPGRNPAHGTSEIRFVLANEAAVRLDLYDVSGRLVRQLVSSTLPSGAHVARWNGTDGAGRPAPSGIYLYAFEADGVTARGRLIYLR